MTRWPPLEWISIAGEKKGFTIPRPLALNTWKSGLEVGSDLSIIESDRYGVLGPAGGVTGHGGEVS